MDRTEDFIDFAKSISQKISDTWAVQREDLLHHEVSGNKWRKLKYNVAHYFANPQYKGIITFGGAFSNHILATASACNHLKIPLLLVVRGEGGDSATLARCQALGATLYFVTRSAYRDKTQLYQDTQATFPDYYLIPEGGANCLGAQGCKEIYAQIQVDFEYLVCAVGTATTVSGLALALQPHQRILAVPVLKNAYFLRNDFLASLCHFKAEHLAQQVDWAFDFHFGGYAKTTPELLDFVANFNQAHQIPIEPIYTGKAFFAAHQLFKPQQKVLLLHTGGAHSAF